jgi:hypothetical protein
MLVTLNLNYYIVLKNKLSILSFRNNFVERALNLKIAAVK